MQHIIGFYQKCFHIKFLRNFQLVTVTFSIKTINLNVVFESFVTQLTSLKRDEANDKEYILVHEDDMIYLYSN